MDNKGPHLPKHVAAVVPHAEEAQHFAVQLQELLELVEGRGRGVRAQRSRLLPTLDVGVCRHGLRGVHDDTLTFQKVLMEDWKPTLQHWGFNWSLPSWLVKLARCVKNGL